MKETAIVTKKMNRKYQRAFLAAFVFLCLMFSAFSCGGPSVQEQLIGAWLVKDYEKIIILNANGTWQIKKEKDESAETSSGLNKNDKAKDGENKAERSGKDEKKENEAGKKSVEGDAQKKESEEKKEDEKKSGGDENVANDSCGLWDIKDKTLMINAEKDVPELEWKKGDKFDFEIIEITPDILKLKDKDAHESEWERVKEDKKGEGKEGESKEAKPVVVEGEPMVINLVQKLQYGKERYLCIKIDYHFKPVEPDHAAMAKEKDGKEDKEKEGKEGKSSHTEPFKYQFIHPAVKDAIIMHLGEMQYRDIRNYDRIQGVRTSLEKRIAPYFNGDLLGIVITDAIITSSRDSIDQFLGQYAPPPEKKEGKGGKEAVH